MIPRCNRPDSPCINSHIQHFQASSPSNSTVIPSSNRTTNIYLHIRWTEIPIVDSPEFYYYWQSNHKTLVMKKSLNSSLLVNQKKDGSNYQYTACTILCLMELKTIWNKVLCSNMLQMREEQFSLLIVWEERMPDPLILTWSRCSAADDCSLYRAGILSIVHERVLLLPSSILVPCLPSVRAFVRSKMSKQQIKGGKMIIAVRVSEERPNTLFSTVNRGM